jgi:thymidylate synthase (FAD)
MKMIDPYVAEIVFHVPEGYASIEKWLERVGRTCYKSEDRITPDSAPKFIRMLRKRGHHAMLEHAVASAHIVADRGLTHELVRHRVASFAQESTRYCNYSKGKFKSEIVVIGIPGETNPSQELLDYYQESCAIAEERYFGMLERGAKPQIARMVLPIGIKSEIVITANLREWMHIFYMRCDTPAHPIIREVCLRILNKFNNRIPSIYEGHYEQFAS